MNTIESCAQPSAGVLLPGRLRKPAVAFVMALLGVSYMFNAFDRQAFPALLGGIRSTYGLTLAQAGFVSTVFTINIAVFGALSGWFLARFTRKSILVAGLVSYSLFTMLTPLAQGFLTLATYRALTGVGEALQIAALYSCLGSYFGKNRGTAMGVMLAFYGLGAFSGPIIGTQLNELVGSWRFPLYLFGVSGVVIAVITAILLPPSFTEAKEAGAADESATFGRTRPATSSVFNRNVCLGALSFWLVSLSLFSYMALYPTYLREHLGYSVAAGGSAIGMYGVGGMGAVVGGWAGDRLGKKGMFVCLVIVASVGFFLFNGVQRPLMQHTLSFMFGLMNSGYFYARFMSLIQRSAHPEKIGYAVAIAMGSSYGSGPIAGFLFGKFVALWGWSTAADLLVVAPPCVALVLMSFFNFSKVREA